MGFIPRTGTVIAIDPDIDRNGVATLVLSKRLCTVDSLTFPEVLEYVKRQAVNAEKPLRVVVEAGWLNRGNWHVTESRNGKWSPSAWAAAVGRRMGNARR
jgi:hypothetical protein